MHLIKLTQLRFIMNSEATCIWFMVCYAVFQGALYEIITLKVRRCKHCVLCRYFN